MFFKMQTKFILTFLVSVLVVLFNVSSSHGNILILPLPIFSAVYKTSCLARELKEHGRDVTVVLPDGMIRETITAEFDLDVIISDGMTKSIEVVDEIANTLISNTFNNSIWGITALTGFGQVCANILNDKELFRSLQERKFSIAIINTEFVNLCISVIPYKLSIPFIREEVLPIDMRNPIHPAVFPVNILLPSTDRMTYLERVGNTLMYFLLLTRPEQINPSDVVGRFAPEKPHITNEELLAKTELFLVDYDELFDYHLPMYPNMIPVGGLATRPPRQLTGKLKVFMDSAVGGAVIVSLGSLVKQIPNDTRDTMLEAFRRLPNLKFVFKNGNKASIDGNVMLLPWIPQNDVLGHPNARLFITHCGQNAQFDAIYNSIPIVGLPVYGDQPVNALKMQAKEYGIKLNIAGLTSKELVSAINTVLNTPSFKHNIAKASALFKSRKNTPAMRAVWWIDHVIKYGGDHLRPPVMNIPFYQFLMLDVIAGILALFTCLFGTCYLSIKCLIRMFQKAVQKQKRD